MRKYLLLTALQLLVQATMSANREHLVTGRMLKFNVKTKPYASLISERAAIAEKTAPSKEKLAEKARQDYEKECQKS